LRYAIRTSLHACQADHACQVQDRCCQGNSRQNQLPHISPVPNPLPPATKLVVEVEYEARPTSQLQCAMIVIPHHSAAQYQQLNVTCAECDTRRICACAHSSDECQPARCATPTQDHCIVGGVTQDVTCTGYHTLHASQCTAVIYSLCVCVCACWEGGDK